MHLYRITSCWIDDNEMSDDVFQQFLFSGCVPSNAARKAAHRILKETKQCQGGEIAELEVAKATDPRGDMTKAFVVTRTKYADPIPGVNFFPWNMTVGELSPIERVAAWLRRFPNNSEAAWRKRPRLGRDDVFLEVFQKRTILQILKRQLLHTSNHLTEALPHEIILYIWHVAFDGMEQANLICK
jgi:hypothetical protein